MDIHERAVLCVIQSEAHLCVIQSGARFRVCHSERSLRSEESRLRKQDAYNERDL